MSDCNYFQDTCASSTWPLDTLIKSPLLQPHSVLMLERFIKIQSPLVFVLTVAHGILLLLFFIILRYIFLLCNKSCVIFNYGLREFNDSLMETFSRFRDDGLFAWDHQVGTRRMIYACIYVSTIRSKFTNDVLYTFICGCALEYTCIILSNYIMALWSRG